MSYSAQFLQGFGGTGTTFQDFLDFVYQTVDGKPDSARKFPLLVDMITTLFSKGGEITINNGQGTGTSGLTISIDPSVLPINPATGTANAHPLSFGMLADALAHELGHALLQNGETAPAIIKATNPDQAVQIGETAESGADKLYSAPDNRLAGGGIDDFAANRTCLLCIEDRRQHHAAHRSDRCK